MASSACLSSATVIKRPPQTQHTQQPRVKSDFSIADLSQPWITSTKIVREGFSKVFWREITAPSRFEREVAENYFRVYQAANDWHLLTGKELQTVVTVSRRQNSTTRASTLSSLGLLPSFLKTDGTLKFDDFSAHQRANFAWCEPTQLDIADSHADQLLDK